VPGLGADDAIGESGSVSESFGVGKELSSSAALCSN
jgi:hypothetical protein